MKFLYTASIVLLGTGLGIAQCSSSQAASTPASSNSAQTMQGSPVADPQTSTPAPATRMNPVTGDNPDTQQNPNAESPEQQANHASLSGQGTGSQEMSNTTLTSSLAAN